MTTIYGMPCNTPERQTYSQPLAFTSIIDSVQLLQLQPSVITGCLLGNYILNRVFAQLIWVPNSTHYVRRPLRSLQVTEKQAYSRGDLEDPVFPSEEKAWVFPLTQQRDWGVLSLDI